MYRYREPLSALLAIGIGIHLIRQGVNQYGVFAVVVLIALGLPYCVNRLIRTRQIEQFGQELEVPFLAEVLLDGRPVGMITDRVVTEMFWRDYKIAALSPELADVVMNDDLWDHCRFTFRDPASQKICLTGFCGGSRPFVREGIISLRGLYFLPEAAAHRLEAACAARQAGAAVKQTEA